MTNKYYVIITKISDKIKKFYVNISHDDERDTILIGGIKKQCIRIFTDKGYDTAQLNLVEYDKKCAIFDELKEGSDIRYLVQAALLFVIKKYPEIKQFEIQDNSMITCTNKQKIPLSILYFIKYNQTWYEKYFDAESEKYYQKVIESDKKVIIDILNDKFKLSTDNFIKKYYNQFSDVNKIKSVYKKDITIGNYLKYFFDNKLDCSYYSNIINDIFRNLLFGKVWFIKKEKILLYPEKYCINIKIINSKKLKLNNLKLNKLVLTEQKGGSIGTTISLYE
jgi:hypothetical protein